MAKASSCCRHRNRWLCLPAIDALPNRNAISKAPRAAGYRGSDFVLWHTAPLRRAALLVRKLEANGRQLVRGRTTRLALPCRAGQRLGTAGVGRKPAVGAAADPPSNTSVVRNS